MYFILSNIILKNNKAFTHFSPFLNVEMILQVIFIQSRQSLLMFVNDMVI